ncbi:hypothetical protein L3Q67_38505 [Saccharothrix sp. AJ9571]|nr:hypothetical protein L3Q67_38505 [Saccharothrix sp. AJ9571]
MTRTSTASTSRPRNCSTAPIRVDAQHHVPQPRITGDVERPGDAYHGAPGPLSVGDGQTFVIAGHRNPTFLLSALNAWKRPLGQPLAAATPRR